MQKSQIDELAKDIAERLHGISAKEEEILTIKEKIISFQGEIKTLEEKKRALEQTVQSERYMISERLAKPVKGDLLEFKK